MPSSLFPFGSTNFGVTIEPAVLISAIAQLSSVVRSEARITAQRVGFEWRPCSDAPDNYDRLRRAYRQSKLTGQALPVLSLHADTTIFADADTNIAMRFWHDVHHVERACDFTAVEEIELALWHLDVLAQRGLRPGSLPWELFRADLIGQTFCSTLLGHFPNDQRRFVLDCVTGGLDWALLEEAERGETIAA